MSSRLTRWLLLVVVPLLIALYASYPPVGVPIEKVRVEKKVAETAEEAAEHGVEVGQSYEEEEVVWKRFLPLAYGERDEKTRLVERKEDGTVVEERTVTVRSRIRLGLDLAGGAELLYELKPEEGEGVVAGVRQTIDILKRRIDPSNVKEFRIQALERDRILIQVPHATAAEVERLKRRLEKMGKLEFKLAAPRPGPSTDPKFVRLYEEADKGAIPDGYVRVHVDNDPARDFYLVKKGEAEITGRDLARIYPSSDEYGLPAVGFELTTMGSRAFAHLTEDNLGWSLAIILDGVLKSAPVIQARIVKAGIIQGRFTQDEVSDMINILRAGSLPMDIQLLQESTVGPQLGRDSIHRGLLALAVAGLFVLTFIGFYYIGCGWVADGALILNLIFLVGVLCILGAALTLPGMAGILLTVGMAVDANVLIFERIREEAAAGKGIRVALRNGYDRAFTTIVDANVTTLLTAIILYLVGTGPIRGFAVTLSFGILLSMFTALVLTRLTFETLIDKGWMEQFKMFSLMRRPAIGFSRIRKPAYLISTLVVVVGVLAFVSRGSAFYDIDFTGGSLVHISLAKPTPAGQIRARLQEGGFADAEVQSIRTAEATREGATDFGIRMKGAGKEKVKETVVPELKRRLATAGILKEGDLLKPTADGRAVELTVESPVQEADVRSALAEGGDIYDLGDLGEVIPTDPGALATRVQARLRAGPSLAEQEEVWKRMIKAFAWAGLARTDYAVEKCQLREATAPDAAEAELDLVLDKPIQWQLLVTELGRRQFSGLSVQPAEQSDAAFILAGERQELERFQKEMPAGSALRGVPVVEIEGLSVKATLTKGFSEPDLRALFEQQGLPGVHIVAEVASKTFRLELSDEPIRRKMRSMFADLAKQAISVTFEDLEAPDLSEGEMRTKMKLSQPMTIAAVKHYIEAAGIAPYDEGIIVGEADYAPEIQLSELTLSLPGEKAVEIQKRVAASFAQPRPVQKVVSIGAIVAQELQGRALLAVIFASVIIVLYVAVRFHAFRFGVAAIVALVHDILITAGLIALADWSGAFGDVKLNLAMLAAFMTILGYSLNDTIVVFDRIRENMAIMGRKTVSADLIDLSINQTLSRTILTSLTTLVVVVVLYLLGGPVLQGLALTLIIGVIVGTYSSMFIASPILLDWAGVTKWTGRFFKVVFLPVTLPFKAFGLMLGGSRS